MDSLQFFTEAWQQWMQLLQSDLLLMSFLYVLMPLSWLLLMDMVLARVTFRSWPYLPFFSAFGGGMLLYWAFASFSQMYATMLQQGTVEMLLMLQKLLGWTSLQTSLCFLVGIPVGIYFFLGYVLYRLRPQRNARGVYH